MENQDIKNLKEVLIKVRFDYEDLPVIKLAMHPNVRIKLVENRPYNHQMVYDRLLSMQTDGVTVNKLVPSVAKISLGMNSETFEDFKSTIQDKFEISLDNSFCLVKLIDNLRY